MLAPERVLSQRQLRRLSPLVLWLWLLALVLASFQPCTVVAAELAHAPVTGNSQAVDHDEHEDRCPGAGERHDVKAGCCDHHYVHCNQPDILKHDHALNIDIQAQARLLQTAAFLLPQMDGDTRRDTPLYHPPADLLRLLSGTRLLI